MRHPAFLNVPRQILYATACLATGLALTLCQAGLVPVSVWILFLDGLMLGILAGVFAYLLWFVVLFAESSAEQSPQRILNHTAMLVLLLALWVGSGYLLERLFFPSTASALSHAIPLKVVFGLLLFQNVIRLYQDWKRNLDLLEEEALDATSIQTPTTPSVHGSSSASLLETISVKTGQKIHLIQVPDILFLQAEGDYVLIHTPDGKFLKEQTMKFFEESLPPEHFVRIHRSCIVHTDCISKIELYEKQNYRITLKTGQQLKASAAGYKQLKAVLQL